MTEKKEYIEREAALRSLFRAPSLSGEQSSDDLTDLILCVARKQIRNVPAADVVEVVRCKDCIFKHKGRCLRDVPYCRDNEYCAVGQRKAVSRNDR